MCCSPGGVVQVCALGEMLAVGLAPGEGRRVEAQLGVGRQADLASKNRLPVLGLEPPDEVDERPVDSDSGPE